MNSLLAGLVVVPTLVIGLGVASPASALSCVGPTVVLEQAKAIYAGRILESSDEELTFEIDEVWRGTPPPEHVTFEVDLPQWWEVERGGRLVVAPADGALNPCTVFALTGDMAEDVRAFRPASPAEPAEPAESTTIDEDVPAQSVVPGWVVAAGGGAVLLLVAGLWWVLRRRRAGAR